MKLKFNQAIESETGILYAVQFLWMLTFLFLMSSLLPNFYLANRQDLILHASLELEQKSDNLQDFLRQLAVFRRQNYHHENRMREYKKLLDIHLQVAEINPSVAKLVDEEIQHFDRREGYELEDFPFDKIEVAAWEEVLRLREAIKDMSLQLEEVYVKLKNNRFTAIVSSLVLLGLTLLAVFLGRRLWLRDKGNLLLANRQMEQLSDGVPGLFFQFRIGENSVELLHLSNKYNEFFNIPVASLAKHPEQAIEIFGLDSFVSTYRIERDKVTEYDNESKISEGGRTRWLLTKATIGKSSREGIILSGSILDISSEKEAEESMREMARGVASGFGERFFSRMSLSLRTAMKARHALIAERLLERPEVFLVRFGWASSPLLEGREFHVNPDVLGDRERLGIELERLFAEDEHVQKTSGGKIAFTFMIDEKSEILGVIAVLNSGTQDPSDKMKSILDIYAARASGEILRLRAERTLLHSYQNLERTIAERTSSLSHVNRSLTREQAFISAVLDTAGALIMLLDDKGRILRFNRECERKCGLSSEKIRGRFFWQELPPYDYSDAIREMFKEVVGGNTRSIEYPIRTVNRDSRLVLWSHSPLERDGEKTFIAVGIDVTDQRRMEEEAELRNQQMMRFDKMVSIGVLSAGMAHEINNPNNFIMMSTNRLKKSWEDLRPVLDEYSEKFGEFLVGGIDYSEFRDSMPALLSGLHQGATRISGIVNSLKEYARQDKGILDQAVDVNLALDTAVMLVNNVINNSTDNFTVHKAELPRVLGNQHKLEQVMINLIKNACEALTDRSQSVWIETGYDKEEQEVIVRVGDTGRGMSSDERSMITDPFFTTRRSSGGTGLGLSISSGIVREHQGKLEFESELGKGTIAELRLPVISA